MSDNLNLIVSKQSFEAGLALGIIVPDDTKGLAVSEFTGNNDTVMVSIGLPAEFKAEGADSKSLSAQSLKRICDYIPAVKARIVEGFDVRTWDSTQNNTKMVTLTKKGASGATLEQVLSGGDEKITTDAEEAAGEGF